MYFCIVTNGTRFDAPQFEQALNELHQAFMTEYPRNVWEWSALPEVFELYLWPDRRKPQYFGLHTGYAWTGDENDSPTDPVRGLRAWERDGVDEHDFYIQPISRIKQTAMADMANAISNTMPSVVVASLLVHLYNRLDDLEIWHESATSSESWTEGRKHWIDWLHRRAATIQPVVVHRKNQLPADAISQHYSKTTLRLKRKNIQHRINKVSRTIGWLVPYTVRAERARQKLNDQMDKFDRLEWPMIDDKYTETQVRIEDLVYALAHTFGMIPDKKETT